MLRAGRLRPLAPRKEYQDVGQENDTTHIRRKALPFLEYRTVRIVPNDQSMNPQKRPTHAPGTKHAVAMPIEGLSESNAMALSTRATFESPTTHQSAYHLLSQALNIYRRI